MVTSQLVKKPRRIMLMGHEITVSYRTKIPGNLQGYFTSDPMRIVVKSSDNWRSILNHEIIHAILWISGHSQKMSTEEEEAFVMALELGMQSIILL